MAKSPLQEKESKSKEQMKENEIREKSFPMSSKSFMEFYIMMTFPTMTSIPDEILLMIEH